MREPSKTTLPAPARTIPDFTPVPRQRMRRGGWSAERQRAFIELLAETGSVRAACHTGWAVRRMPPAMSKLVLALPASGSSTAPHWASTVS